jgi:hemolysin activation/secretion protein
MSTVPRNPYRLPATLAALCAAAAAHGAPDPSSANAPAPVANPAQAAAPATATGTEFQIGEFRVLGNTTLPVRAIETAVYPFLGPHGSLQVVQKAQAALVAAYRKAGFGTVLVDIPEQSVDEGIVRLKVTEGRVENVHISGARYYSEGRILAELPSLKTGTVPSLPALQSELSQVANEARDRQVTPVLKAGSEPGTVAVDLNVSDHLPVHGSIQVDDRYTADTTHTRLTGILSYDNLFQRFESLSLQYETAPERPSQVQLWALTYLGRTSDPDLTWSVYAIRSDSDVAAVGTLSVIGNGKIFGAHLTQAWYPSAAWSESLNFGVDYKDFAQDVTVEPATSSTTPIHYFVWSALFTASGHGAHLDSTSSLALNAALRDVGDNDQEFDFNRYGARSNFMYLRGSEALTYRMWHDSGAVLRLGVQYTDTPLVNNEQFSLGGFDSVRGYLEAETLVDRAVQATFELHAPQLSWAFGRRLQVYAFFDIAEGMIVDALPSQDSRFTLDSWGFGLQVALFGLDAFVGWADPLRDGPRTERGDSRVLFLVKYGF